MLHITNGDSVVGSLRESGLAGAFLAWMDALHDGPVPSVASLPGLSDIRARALAGFGWSSYEAIRGWFAERDARLAGYREHDEVVLWFEHDLYDQLQLLQVLDWFATQEASGTRLSLIQIDSHPEVTPFFGLGQLNGRQLAALFPQRVVVGRERLEDAAVRWRSFTSADHSEMTGLDRLLEEYPWVGDGLSRTQRQLLQAAAGEAKTRCELYAASQRFEDVPWGDASVWLRLDDLAAGPNPALAKVAPDEYRLTATGLALLAGEADWIAARGGIDTWIGGVHLTGLNPQWRWCPQACQLLRQSR